MRKGDRERERRKEEEEEKLYYVHTERKNEKEKTGEKNMENEFVMFNIMPSLCLKVTSRRHHLLVCTYVIHFE